ncbi:MAG: proline dehydrogenase family protein [Blastocatellia bacterium]
MPGEEVDDAIRGARELDSKKIGTVFTHLGENIADEGEARKVRDHYLQVLGRIEEASLATELSVKLTQLGLDLDTDLCYSNLEEIIKRAGEKGVVWIDMEASNYVDATLDLFRRARRAYPNVGVCLQAYLYRTEKDLADLLPLGPAIRLVKGAYKEPPDIAYPKKKDVDENYFALVKTLLGRDARNAGVRAAIATHDRLLIRRIEDLARELGVDKSGFEFQMLFGIQRAEQIRLANDGYRSVVLIAYGDFWYPWFMRRLAERPANVTFLLRNVFSG